MEECRHTQGRHTHHLSCLVLQSHSTPGKFDMWKNAVVPRADLPCQLSQVLQSPSTPGMFHVWKNTDVPRADVPPANQAKCYWALVHQVSFTCGRMQMYTVQSKYADMPNRKCSIFCSSLQNTSIMQDQESRQTTPRNTYYGSTGKWCKSPM